MWEERGAVALAFAAHAVAIKPKKADICARDFILTSENSQLVQRIEQSHGRVAFRGIPSAIGLAEERNYNSP